MRFQTLWAGVALAGAATAQFLFPNSSASLQLNRAIQIQWSKSGLQAPISINLVPAGAAIRQDVVLQQVAVNIGNVGVLQWTADETITAFPKFAMVIIDARSQVVVSQPFLIQSLTRQPTQQIDLSKSGSAAGKTGSKQNADKEKAKNSSGDDNKNNKDSSSNNNNNKGADKGANKDGKKDSAGGNGQKEQAKGKDQNKGGLLPLPGLPDGDAPPVSLKPLPNPATSSSTSTQAPTQTATPEKPKPDQEPAAPAAGDEAKKAAPAAPVEGEEAQKAAPAAPEVAAPEAPAPAAPKAEPDTPKAAAPEAPKPAPEAVPKEVAPAAPASTTPTAPEEPAADAAAPPPPPPPAPIGFATVQPPSASETPALTPAPEVEAAAAPKGLQNAAVVVAGGSFREQTSDTWAPAPTLLPLPSLEGQKTITTAITPRPASVVSSEARAAAASETGSGLQGAVDAKPTIKAEKNGGQRREPSLVLGLLGAAVVVGLLL